MSCPGRLSRPETVASCSRRNYGRIPRDEFRSSVAVPPSWRVTFSVDFRSDQARTCSEGVENPTTPRASWRSGLWVGCLPSTESPSSPGQRWRSTLQICRGRGALVLALAFMALRIWSQCRNKTAGFLPVLLLNEPSAGMRDPRYKRF
jgi:hypothetical protein